VILRMHMDVFMPGLMAAMAKMPSDQNPLGPGFDANAPFMQINQELSELSTAPIADAVFQVPEGFESAPVADLMKTMIARHQPAVKQ
jgi:hypothetical protein